MSLKPHAWKIIVIAIYNILLSLIIFKLNWDHLGAAVVYLIFLLYILFFTPIIVGVLFMKHKNLGLIIVINLAITICFFRISLFFEDSRNSINNIFANNADNRKIQEIKNSSEYLQVASTEEFNLYINYVKIEGYIIFSDTKFWRKDNIFQRDRKLTQIELIEDNRITDEFFNKNIIYTNKATYLNNSVVVKIKWADYETKYKNQMILKINDDYYKIDGCEHLVEEIARTDIILDKVLTMLGVESYEVGKKEPYMCYEFYSNDTLDYFIVRQEVGAEFEFDETFYKCNLEEKNDSQRLEEYKNYIYKNEVYEWEVIKNTYILNNDKIHKVITYDFGNQVSWIEIVFKELDYSIFTNQWPMPAIEGRSFE